MTHRLYFQMECKACCLYYYNDSFRMGSYATHFNGVINYYTAEEINRLSKIIILQMPYASYLSISDTLHHSVVSVE